MAVKVLDFANLTAAPVDRAAVVAWKQNFDRSTSVALLDASPERFVAPIGVPDYLTGTRGTHRAFALSPDGRLLLGIQSAEPSVVLIDPSTGSAREYSIDQVEYAEWPAAGAIDPTNKVAALISNCANLRTLNLDSGETRLVWQAEGGWSAESTVAWAPDGSSIAFNYLWEGPEDDELRTVVVEPSGVEVRRFDYSWLVPPGNSAWKRDGYIGLFEEISGRDFEVHPESGDERPRTFRYAIGRVADGFILDARDRENRIRYDIVDLDGSNRRPLFEAKTVAGFVYLDIAVDCPLAYRP